MTPNEEKRKWYVSDVLDDGHNGIVTNSSEIVIGYKSPLTEEQAEKIVAVHNRDILALNALEMEKDKEIFSLKEQLGLCKIDRCNAESKIKELESREMMSDGELTKIVSEHIGDAWEFNYPIDFIISKCVDSLSNHIPKMSRERLLKEIRSFKQACIEYPNLVDNGEELADAILGKGE